MMDCFRMQSQKQTHIELRLSLRARNLLVEEYPLAERDIRRKGNGWVLSTEVSAMEDVGRFVAGLVGEVEIMKGDELKEYLRNYFSRCMKAIK